MKKLDWQHIKYFLIPYALFLISGALIMLQFDKETLHLWFNQWYHNTADQFFKIYTFAGNGVFAVLVSLAFFIKRIRLGLFFALGTIFSSILVNILKHLFFKDTDRPAGYFTHWFTENRIRLVPDYEVYTGVTFPSGHSALGFMLLFSLALICRKKIVSLLCILLALLIGYSRIYLSQHFFADVYFGSMIGILSSLLAYWISFHPQLNHPRMSYSPWQNLNPDELA